MNLNKICVIILAIFCHKINNVVTVNLPEVMEKDSPAYTIMMSSQILDSSSKCKRELDLLKAGIDAEKLWSLKILDSSGEPKPGFIYGNNFWLGLKTQCFDAGNRDDLEISPNWQKNNSKYRNIEEEYPPFEVNYFIARFRHNSTIQYHFQWPYEDMITLGLCLPATCATNELSIILEKIFRERRWTVSHLYSADFSLLNVVDLRDDYKWLLNWNIIVIVTILITIILITTLGTFYDIYIYQKRVRAKEVSLTATRKYGNTRETAMTNNPTLFGQLLLCFSVYTNTKKIFNTKSAPDTIEMINGVRFIGMVFIIFLHTGYFALTLTDNTMWIWRLFARIYIAVMRNQGFFVVDTFFFLGGFLVAWAHFKRRNKKNEQPKMKKSIYYLFDQIIKRFVRITPAYMVTLCIVELSFMWLSKNSIFFIDEKPQESCPNYWWINLLYINNFLDVNSMCMTWSWYLPNDMQFFIITQILLILSDVYFYASTILLFCLLALSIIISGYLSYINEFTFTMGDLYLHKNVIYTPPWMRIGPYLIGTITGYIYIQIKGKLKVSKKVLSLLWICGAGCLIAALCGSLGGIKSVMSSAIYIALCRTFWGIGIAWLLIACQTGNAGVINKILSHKLLNPLGKLSYCAYLLNPVVIGPMMMTAESSFHADITPFAVSFVGFTTLTYGCAYLLTVAVELPFISVHRVLKKYFENSRRSQITL